MSSVLRSVATAASLYYGRHGVAQQIGANWNATISFNTPLRRSLTVLVVDKTFLQKIFSVQGPDPHPEEDDDDDSHDEEHYKGDGDTDEGGGVETETLRNWVEVDHNLILVILSQLELNICRGHNLTERKVIRLLTSSRMFSSPEWSSQSVCRPPRPPPQSPAWPSRWGLCCRPRHGDFFSSETSPHQGRCYSPAHHQSR